MTKDQIMQLKKNLKSKPAQTLKCLALSKDTFEGKGFNKKKQETAKNERLLKQMAAETPVKYKAGT